MEKPKALLLYSGGFDSTVLLLDLVRKGYDVTTLFFHYGQRNFEQEAISSNHWELKLGITCVSINLPKMPWSTSKMLETGENAGVMYIEMRNLIFLSYAISYAESQGIREVYTGFIGADEYYADNSLSFLKAIDNLSFNAVGIEVLAPFIYESKDSVYAFALEFADMKEILDNTFSCNTPVNGKPCGKCNDCDAIESYQKLNKP